MAIKQLPPQPESAPDRRQMLVGKGWVQGVALVMVFGFFVMGILAYRTYAASMPQPVEVVTPNGDTLFTGADITAGQELFLARGLMEYGSIVGHGGYLGPDYTADYLRRATTFVEDELVSQGAPDPHSQVVEEFRTNRYDEATQTLTFTDAQARAFEANKQHYADFFGTDSTQYGLLPKLITDPTEIHQLTAFFGWTAWAAAAERPGHTYSYTNNWPAEPRVDNGPTADVVVWSVLSLIVLLGGTGALFAVYGRWSQGVGWHSAEAPAISFRQPDEVKLTPAQRATAWFFFTIAALFLVQTVLGGLTEHYRADTASFFGVDVAAWLPFNLARTWHLQLSLFWTAAGFLAAGIFLTPFIAGREPKRQAVLVYILFGAVVLVVVGSLISEALSIHGVSCATGPLFAQQWEYIDLPRVWQILL
ncbi:MAG: cbb3-type cytochrome c oxidase subunit I, partial [Microlunatus sp.]|nr:cbb3-type cytochrome c oxidase subunit I [Microlunatus sp.]